MKEDVRLTDYSPTTISDLRDNVIAQGRIVAQSVSDFRVVVGRYL